MDEKDLIIQTLRQQNMELSGSYHSLLEKYGALRKEAAAGPDEQQRRIRKLERETEKFRELLPVMPGDTIFVIVRKKKPVAVAWRVIAIEIDEFGRSVIKCGWYQDRYQAVSARRLGETWFLTREEAETAIASDSN